MNVTAIMERRIVMKKNTAIACLCMLIFGGAVGWQWKAPKEKESHYSYASWAYIYESVEEMEADSDLIVEGRVAFQTTQLRGEEYPTVYTLSTVEIVSLIAGEAKGAEPLDKIEGNLSIIIQQTGGIYGAQESPVIYGAPLLEIGDEYLLYLKYEPSRFGNNYSIAAGNQGYARIEYNLRGKEYVGFGGEDHRRILGIVEDPLEQQRAVCPDPYSTHWDGGWYTWPDNTNIKYYLTGSVTGNGTSFTNQVKNGIAAWRNATEHLSVTRVYNETTALVTVLEEDEGHNYWNGYAAPHCSADMLNSVEIKLNTNVYAPSYGTDFWQGVACHEMGHVMGLNHTEYGPGFSCSCNSYDLDSIMLDPSQRWYIRGIVTPQNNDLRQVEEKYYEIYDDYRFAEAGFDLEDAIDE